MRARTSETRLQILGVKAGEIADLEVQLLLLGWSSDYLTASKDDGGLGRGLGKATGLRCSVRRICMWRNRFMTGVLSMDKTGHVKV